MGLSELHRPAATAGTSGAPYSMGWYIEGTAQGTRLWHGGTNPEFFAYMVLLPDQKLGMVLLVNANHMVFNFALEEVSRRASLLLAGFQRSSFPWAAIPWLVRGALIIPILQCVDLLRTLRFTRRWQRDPGSRPSPVRIWLFHILIPSLFLLLIAVNGLALLLTELRVVLLLFMPDLAWLSLISGGLALAWLPLRSLLIRSVIRGN